MNKKIRLSKSGIEYLDYAWGLYSGCWNWKNGICPIGENCWAKRFTERFKRNYPNGFRPTFYPEAFLSPIYLKKPSRISVGWMGDLFGDWVDPDMKFHSTLPSGRASITMSLRGWIFTTIKQCPQHTFLFKTKCGWNLPKWSPFLDNCEVGVSVSNNGAMTMAMTTLPQVQAKVRYISFEPLLGSIGMSDHRSIKGIVDWVIIGAQTKPHKPPRWEWVSEIIDACVKAGIPYFLKDNLEKVVPRTSGGFQLGKLVQQFPTT